VGTGQGINIASTWEVVADGIGDRTALVNGDNRRSWTEFEDRSARLAAAFTELGCSAGGKVASMLYNGNEYMEGLFASFKARAAPVNVNYRYVEDELLYLLDNSDTDILLFHGDLAERVDAVRNRVPGLKAVVQVDDGSPHLDGALRYEDLIAAHDPAPRIDRSGDDLYILYTGGTTGTPKGVMWRHDDVFGSLAPTVYPLAGHDIPTTSEEAGRLAAEFVDEGRVPVQIPASPLMHGTGFFTQMIATTVGGTAVTLTERHFNPRELWETVEREGVTQVCIVGDAFGKPMVDALEAAESEGRAYDLSSLFLIISSGVMWSAPVKKALSDKAGVICIDTLGSSEGIGFGASMDAPGSEAKTARFTIGDTTKVFTEDGREIEPGSGEKGLLALAGAIPLGYYKDPDKTATTFPTYDGVRYSIPGDWATVEADGTINLLGRGSVSINTGGEKVYPEEVEEAVKSHPAVADAVVVGVPDEKFGQAVTAVVQLEPGAAASPEEIADATRGHLAGFKRPRHVVVVDAVQRGPNGKTDYAWAKEQALARIG